MPIGRTDAGPGDNALVDRPQPPRVPFDAVRYVRRAREGPCFVCAILAGHPDYPHHDVCQDAVTIAFLARPPTLPGYCIVAPRRHVEDWAAGAAVVPVERMYCLSPGSQQGNAHLHGHVAPLPPGAPDDQQQYHALMTENGVLDVGDSSRADLATAIRSCR